MPEIIQCPTCQRELQIPAELVGTPVKCPSCGSNFVTTPSAATTPLPRLSDVTAPVSMTPPVYTPPPPPPPDPNQARRAVMTPALILLLLAALWLVFDCYQIYQTIHFNPEDAAPLLELLPPGPFRESVEKELQAAADPVAVRNKVIYLSIMCVTSLIVLAGAVQMLRLRSWWLALTASILTIVHFNHCCCAPINMVAGIGAVIVLILPWVRSAFQ